MKRTLLFQMLMPLALLLITAPAFSQVTEAWVKQYSGTGSSDDVANSVAADASGNVYVTGSSGGDYATIKYDAAGNQLWLKRYRNGNPTEVLVDASGNVYVTGGIFTSGNNVDFATIKYDMNGVQLWAKTYNGPRNGPDFEEDMALDASGNVYVTGSSFDPNSEGYADYTTIKYDAAGNQLWVKQYNGGSQSGPDGASSVAVDASGNVYVTGSSYNADGTYDYATIKYDATGNQLWVTRYNTPENPYNNAFSVAVDASGSVFVTGISYNNSGIYNLATVKYDGGGNQLWEKRYNGPVAFENGAPTLAVEGSGNVYVGTSIQGATSGNDYVTLKYDGAGNEIWVRKYNGPGNSNDEIGSLSLDASGNVYITGQSGDSYATVKYDAAGAELWVKRYNTPESGNFSKAFSLAVDGAGNVYVTGFSGGFASETGSDYVTIKYSQTQTAQTISSFTLINADNNTDIRDLKDGDTINLAALSYPTLTMRANTDPAVVGSVLFRLTGPLRRGLTENNAPYSLFANKKTNYYGLLFPTGNYTLNAIPFSAAGAKGTRGTPLTIRFTIINPEANTITETTIQNAQNIAVTAPNNSTNLTVTPNPFFSRTQIHFAVPKSGYTTVQVYDVKGMVVARLYQAWAEAGKTYQVPLERNGLQSGMYILKVANGKYEQSKKLVIGL